MIIIGDIASPSERHSQILSNFFNENVDIFRKSKLICNLEGLVSSDDSSLSSRTPILFNHPSVIDTLIKANIGGIGLANNHTLDLPEEFANTKKLLEDKKVFFSGAGYSLEDAVRPFTVIESGKDILVYNFCWHFLLYHQNNPQDGVYVASLDELKLLRNVKEAKKIRPEIEIVVYLHWSFDLETLPFPSYRQFARLLIDNGVIAVVGCHSHCVQGGEKYKEGFIVYGLGNFFIPQNVYANGTLSFPKMSKLQLAFEYDFGKKRAFCHWFEYDSSHEYLLKHIASEDFEDSKLLAKYSPYSPMTNREYLAFFRRNRRKKFLVPVFKNIFDVRKNALAIQWLKLRATSLRLLSRYGIRKWQN